MSSAAEAIARYHDLLTDDMAQDSQAMLDDQLRRRGLVFGERTLCTVLRPRLMTPERYGWLRVRVRRLMGALGKAYAAALADPELLRQFRLLDWELELITHDPGFRDPSPTSRLDAFVLDDPVGMALTEYNAETPAGAAFTDALTEAFADLPVMRAFARRYAVRPLPSRHGVLHVLLDAYQQWCGRRETPRIAIVDWPEVPTRSEFLLFQQYFQAMGLACVIVDPREMHYRQGRLYAAGQPVDLIYKRVLISELVEQEGLRHPVIQAVRDNAVCMVNPFRSKILHKKASLAVLSDERNAALFDPEELEVIRAHVPWTRVVEDRRTEHRGRPVDLLAHSAERKDEMVLKPNDDYGGAGIVLGWEVSGAAWADALRQAVERPTIVQERVPIPSEPYPSLVNGSVAIQDRMIDTAPFVSYGDFADGCLTRLSTAALLNVTAGGGSTVPTFLVEER